MPRQLGIGTSADKRYEIGVQLLHRATLFARFPSFGFQLAHQILGKGVTFAHPFRYRKFWLDGLYRQMFSHCIM